MLKYCAFALLFLIIVPVQPPVSTIHHYYDDYQVQRQAVADLLLSNYNSSVGLLGHAEVGSCGAQENGYSLIDENFLAQYALAPYYPVVAANISINTAHYLALSGYNGTDRREVLFGIPVPSINSTYQTTVAGQRAECPAHTGFWIMTELPSNKVPNYNNSVNLMSVHILNEFLHGNVVEAQQEFNTMTGWWNGTGFMSPIAVSKGLFFTRDLAYYIFVKRATHFDSNITEAVASQMWSLQGSSGGLWTVYHFNGAPYQTHTSNEINALALLDYEVFTWWGPE